MVEPTPVQLAVLVCMRRTGTIVPADTRSHTTAALVAGGWLSRVHRLTPRGAGVADAAIDAEVRERMTAGRALAAQRARAYRTAIEEAQP